MKRITRRKFFEICAKISLVGVLLYLVPFRIERTNSSEAGRRFCIRLKPFNREDLFRTHNLRG
ncbi:MAG: hypothetical protein JSW17_02170 [Candidatus Omnitrophota bacterium]|nr:MAG: hypothetical protein JSW17_02170 [Candidatus Omnitrophota bacterium]